MKIIFNGTGASEGFPALFCECQHCNRVRTMDVKNFRMRTSCLIDESLLVDFSADTYARCLYGKLDLRKVKNIIITHSHADHLYPQDLCKITPPSARHNRELPLKVFGNKSVGRVLESGGATQPKVQQYLQFDEIQAFYTYSVDGYEITPLPANHDLKQECFIFIIKRNETVLLYGHDSGYFLEESWAALKDFHFNAVVLDCTSGAKECPFKTHMGIPDNIKIRERMYQEGMANKSTTFILTHFAHSFGPFYDDMKKIADENGFVAAYDGFEIEIK